MADIDFGGATKDVCLSYLPDLELGEYAIVHAGFAITRLDEVSALASLASYRALGMIEGELGITLPPEPAIATPATEVSA
jgi:hydrogenase expression/formation protein HypC